MDIPVLDDLKSAASVVHEQLHPTLLYDWPLLRRRMGFDFHLKHENHQPTGAFKVRGGINLISRLDAQSRQQGVIGCSTGNHGQSLAFAARRYGAACTIVVPEGNNPGKNASIRELGAELIEFGQDFDAAKVHCESVIEQRGSRYVHSANEPLLIAGVGTMALEIFDELEPDVIIVPIGLGSGICGTALASSLLGKSTQIIGVQSTGAPAVRDSWKGDQIVSYDRIDTFAEGLATRVPAEMTLDIMRKLVDDIVLVSDEELRDAVRWILTDTHNLPEPAGAASTAAAWKLRAQLQGKVVVGVLSGGNYDVQTLGELFG